jgi:hypothetical protein
MGSTQTLLLCRTKPMSKEIAPDTVSSEPRTPDFRFVNYKYPHQEFSRPSNDQNINNIDKSLAPAERAALGRLILK